MAENIFSFKTAFKDILRTFEEECRLDKNIDKNKETSNENKLTDNEHFKNNHEVCSLDVKCKISQITEVDESHIIEENREMFQKTNVRESHILDEVNEATKIGKDPDINKKLYIGNISDSTSERRFVYYFEQYGEVLSCIILREGMYGKSLGLGFILFKEAYSIQKVLQSTHEIDNKYLFFFPEENGMAPVAFRKLHLRNLHPDISAKDVKNYFEKYGAIKHCVKQDLLDKTASIQSGYILFEQLEDMNNCLSLHHKLHGKNIDLHLYVEVFPEPEYLRKLNFRYYCHSLPDVSFYEHFQQFGLIDTCVIMKERKSKKVRGLGYVIFHRAFMVDNCFLFEPHDIENKTVEIWRCSENIEDEGDRKIILDNLNYETTEDMLIYYFEQFGAVESCSIYRSGITGLSTGKGYILLENRSTVPEIFKIQKHIVDYRRIKLSLSEMRNEPSYFYFQRQKRIAHAKKCRMKNYNINDFAGAGVNLFKDEDLNPKIHVPLSSLAMTTSSGYPFPDYRDMKRGQRKQKFRSKRSVSQNHVWNISSCGSPSQDEEKTTGLSANNSLEQNDGNCPPPNEEWYDETHFLYYDYYN